MHPSRKGWAHHVIGTTTTVNTPIPTVLKVMTVTSPPQTATDIRANLLGAWRLVTWQSINTDGTVDYPLGPDAVGQLMYTDNNRMSAQLAAVDQPPFASDDWR